jgi:hypothetical protein
MNLIPDIFTVLIFGLIVVFMGIGACLIWAADQIYNRIKRKNNI